MKVASEMAELLVTLYAGFDSGDSSSWEEALAADVLFIGSDELEWWQGRDEVRRAARAQTAEMHGAGIRFRAGDPQIVANGDTVWVADRPTIHLADGTVIPTRLTLVASAVDGRLVLRQMHVSVGAANEQVLDQTLTV
jgi:ketosteroid isomerase-like protein